MFISYANSKVKKQCTKFQQAKKDFPEKIAIKLHRHIAFIKASENLESVNNFPTFNLHPLKGNREGYYAMDIDGRHSQYRLIVAFEDYTKEQVIYDAKSISVIEITEVSKHYE
ncbi:type II toxin-antitoxin system RelE/ParE family toxin [Paucilactobacillus nenjiangensis]|uniref:type II toxin-antitoxin system RelE/ParE family toxin n=1 Tax=Paucilactobacillus nenjiangensis TaxID=1296540 RepID=UPI003BB782F7